MQLSATSSTVIDLVLLTDAVNAEDTEESRRLARRLARVARASGWPVIAKQARAVELLAILGAPFEHVAAAVERLLLMTERLVHPLPASGTSSAHSQGASSESHEPTPLQRPLRQGAV